MPVARGVRLVRLNPPASQGGSTGRSNPQLARGVRLVDRTPQASRGGSTGRSNPQPGPKVLFLNRHACHLFPTSKSAVQVLQLPPRIYGTSSTTPLEIGWKTAPITPPLEFTPSKSAGKLLQLPPSNLRNFTTPPRNRLENCSNYPPLEFQKIFGRTTLFKTLATALYDSFIASGGWSR